MSPQDPWFWTIAATTLIEVTGLVILFVALFSSRRRGKKPDLHKTGD